MSAFNAETISGKLPKKNVRLEVAREALEFKPCKLRLFSIGDRTFLDTEDFAEVLDLVKAGQRSDYYDSFRQGATIVPRQFWFVDVVLSPRVGINPSKPTVVTSRRAIDLAKKEYENVELKGQVEKEFLFQAATGSELVPFGHLELPLVILPIENNAGRYRIIDREEARARGASGLTDWLSSVEHTWKDKRGEKAERMTACQWLDYAHKLANQSSRTTFRVVFNSSGTYLVACLVKNKPHEITVNGTRVRSNGVVADYKSHYWDTNDDKEAYYVIGFLNAPIIDRLIKPMQSKGDFGERDIGKKVLELPIPRYDSGNKSHKELSDLARVCTGKVELALPALGEKYDSIGKIRQVIKGQLEAEIAEIDKLAKTILLSRRKVQKLDKLLRLDS